MSLTDTFGDTENDANEIDFHGGMFDRWRKHGEDRLYPQNDSNGYVDLKTRTVHGDLGSVEDRDTLKELEATETPGEIVIEAVNRHGAGPEVARIQK